MKLLTLNETWTLCLRMWQWIAKEIEKDKYLDVIVLKRQWIQEHGFEDEYIKATCFFCEYNTQRNADGCEYCPGKLVSRAFECGRKSYNYKLKPEKFYERLVELNNKRQEANRKGKK